MTPPFDQHSSQTLPHAPVDPRAELESLRARLAARLRRDLPGGSVAAQALRAEVLRAAEVDRAVLLLGSPGGDAERVARCLHDYGRETPAAFESLCGEVDSSQALQTRLVTCGLLAGCVDEIDTAWRAGGTLFLQRIDALALPLQKLLADALGRREKLDRSDQPDRPEWRTSVRLVLSLERAPRGLLAAGALRHDLHEAVAPLTIAIPPLRDRREDIAELAQRFLDERARHGSTPATTLSDDALELFERHDWPGDVGELKQVLDSALATESAETLSAEAIRPWIDCHPSSRRESRPARETASSDHGDPFPTLREMERRLIEAAFARCDGNRERTARCLGIGIRTLSGKLREYGYPPRGGPGSNGAAQPLRRAG